MGGFEPDGGSLRSAAAWARWVTVAILISVVVALWPPLGAPLDGSFDSSWRWALGESAALAAPTGLLPAGPLGHWMEPRVVAGGSLAAAARYEWALRLALAGALATLALRRPRPTVALGAAALWVGATLVCDRWPDYDLVLLVLALVLPVAGGERLSVGRALTAGVVAGMAPLLKISAGIEALGLLCGAQVAAVAVRRPRAARPAWMAAGWAVAFAGGAALRFPDLSTFTGWLRAQPRVAASFGAAMALGGGPAATLASVGPIAVLLLACALEKGRRRLGLLALLVLPAAALYKHASVRLDTHALAPGYFATAALALLSLTATSGRRVARAQVLAVLALAMSVPLAARLGRHPLERAQRLALVGEGWTNLRQSLEPSERERELRASGRVLLAPWRDPELERLGSMPGGVDVLPWRLTALVANGLERRWVASPSFQLYRLTNPGLEGITARHFESSVAPRWLVVDPEPLDGRNLLWEAPRVWRAVAACYRVVRVVGARRQLLLLERRASPGVWVRRPLGETTLRWGEWAPTPLVDDGETLAAEVTLEPTALGGLEQFATRAEPVHLVVSGPGRARRFRVVPTLGRLGLDLSAPRSTDETAEWLGGKLRRGSRAIRLLANDASRYRSVVVRWVAWRLTDSVSPRDAALRSDAR